jgi:archaeal flagellar protein FlaJ
MNNAFKKEYNIKKKGLNNSIQITSKEKNKYLKELKLENKQIKKALNVEKKVEKKQVSASVIYKTNFYAKLSNFFMDNISFRITKKNPKYIQPLLSSLAASNIRILSKTYLSMILFSSLISFPIFLIVLFLLTGSILISLFSSILVSIAVFGIAYSYPFTIANERRSKIDQELVFGVVHMASIAGSGAQPINIFKLLVDSNEYDELKEELKRILNYVNIFGYNLSTALKAVANSTPSMDLKELFGGMISTIETGGDIRQYLSDKSKDSLNKYRLDQKKRLEAIATYSEVYTGFLIAGPLLFIVTFAILEKVSPVVSGIPISTLATMGTFVVLPFLNILFILFLETNRGISQ